MTIFLDGAPQGAHQVAARRVAAAPVIRTVSRADVKAAIADGMADFRAAPQFGLVFGGLYAAAGLLLAAIAALTGWAYVIFPLAAGFALLGPFVAVGLYEVSRRRERGVGLSWRGVLGVVHSASGREIAMLGFVLVFVMIAWVKLATFIYAFTFGLHPVPMSALFDVMLTTPRGLVFLLVGNAVGAALAALVFAFSVVSFPLLLDRDVDFVTGMAVSVRAVLANPGPMFAFALIIASSLAAAVAPLFLLLPVALPVLGHATWHLYRRVIA